jgi:beta-galactosidase/beta-glucuronidase
MKRTLITFLLIAAVAATAQAGRKATDTKLITPWGEKVTAENAWREYPRPQMVRDNWTCLNGTWDYSITTNKRGFAEIVETGKILVPFSFESKLSGVNRLVEATEKMVYTRTIEAHPKAGRRVLLNFEAVDWRAQVYVNGVEATDVPVEGGYLPFSLDVTDLLKDGANELKVVAWDPTDTFIAGGGKQNWTTSGCFYTRVSGIWQTVWMEEVPVDHVTDVAICPDIDKGTVRFDVKATGYQPMTIRVLSAGKTVAEAKVEKLVDTAEIRMPKGFRLWSPKDPFLYDYELVRGEDVVKGYFGMRKFDRAKDARGAWRFRLNNEFIFPVGTLDQGWWPDGHLTPPSLEACANDIATLKKCGFDMLRKHIKVEPRAYYALCDKMGLMVFQDGVSPAGLGNIFDEKKSLQRYGMFRREWKAEVELLRSHPSIVMWIPYNEAWGQPDADGTRDTLRWTKRFDPSRLVSGVSGWTEYEEDAFVDKNGGVPSADTVDVHAYPGPGQTIERRYRVSLLGEFGGLGVGIADHIWNPGNGWGYGGTGKNNTAEDIQKKYLELFDRVAKLSEEGLSGCVYTQTSDVELEVNGLLTYDRRVLKFDAEKLRAAADKVRATMLKAATTPAAAK